MTEHDILNSIASNLSERSSSAALSNYAVLGNNIKYVNELLKFAIFSLDGIQGTAFQALGDPSNLKDDFKGTGTLASFSRIVPRVLANGLVILEKFAQQTEPDDRSGITISNVGRLQKGFVEYNNLVTITRQIVDSLVSDSYQLAQLDPRSLNYHVLVSLNSFDRYVTPSIRQALFNKDVSDALDEFRKLPFKQWKNSSITQCSHPTFVTKIDFLFSHVNPSPEAGLGDDLKDLFKFSSEFTHIGYVSTFFASSLDSEVIFGDDIGPYLPSTENFSELKYQMLETVTKLMAQVYFPFVRQAIQKMLTPASAKGFEVSLRSVASEVQARLKTRNSQYYFFIKKDLIGSDAKIELQCMCSTLKEWTPPHDKGELYCKNCGSHFNLLEVEGDGGYVITSSGPVKIIGANVPDFHELPIEEQLRMLKEVDALTRKKMKS